MTNSSEGYQASKRGAVVKGFSMGEGDMALINAQALEPLDASQVFAFTVRACDNDVDRDFERFSDEALEQMAELMVGKTIIKDHNRKADNQFARIYDAAVEDAGGTTVDGRPLKQLTVKCYTLACDANAQAIAEIKAGIKREVSVSFSPTGAVCSVCGKDRMREWCEHFWGEEYEGSVCSFEFTGADDAYELSFVAVPAQRNAGVGKSYGPEEPEDVARALESEGIAAPEGEAKLEAEAAARAAEEADAAIRIAQGYMGLQ